MLSLPKFPAQAVGAIWDTRTSERTFVVYDDSRIYTYVYYPDHVDGPHCVQVGATALPHGLVPLRLSQGTLACLTPSGKTASIVLDTHKLCQGSDVSEDRLADAVRANQALGKFRAAFAHIHRLQSVSPSTATLLWEPLARAAMRALEISEAMHIYRAMGKAAMVQTLRGLLYAEDANLLAGHVCLLMGEAERAERLFLSSSSPQEALNMHRDLLQWEQALRLAERFSKGEIPYLSREYAQQLEFQGQWTKAKQLYETALTNEATDRQHNDACKAGLARTSIRNGEVTQGVGLANELKSKSVYRDCAAALEAMGQLGEAAAMFEKAEQFERACNIYLKSKNWAKVCVRRGDGWGECD
jgi:WD repeat-containing protein 19